MRYRFAIPLMLGFAVACAGSESSETGTDDDEAAIRALNTAYGTHWTNADTAGMLGLMADDWEDVAPDGTHTTGKAAAAAMMSSEFAARPPGMAMTANTSFVKFLDEDIAISGGTWTITGGPPGAPTSGSWNETLRKEDGTWKVVTALGAPNMPMPAAMESMAAPE
jgi:uncharacterized protein (TIGR02246 family)